MFSNRVANSANFLQMPAEAQLLFFHMVLRADDDGIVESYPIMRLLGTAPDAFRVLVAKGFIKQINEDQVVLISEWLEHNTIRADRKVDSLYLPKLLEIYPDHEYVVAKPRKDVQDNSRRVDCPRSAEGKLSKGKESIVSQAKLSSQKGTEEFTVVTEHEVERQPRKESHPETARVVARFVAKVKSELDLVVKDSVAGRAIVKRALTRISEQDCYEKIDEWFTRSLKDQSLMSITHCFSDNEVNGFLTGYAK